MDDPSHCPDYYRDASAEAGISQSAAFIGFVSPVSYALMLAAFVITGPASEEHWSGKARECGVLAEEDLERYLRA